MTEMQRRREREKQAAAYEAAREIQSGMLLGLGTGSTVRYLIERVGELIQEGLVIRAAATSRQTGELAAARGIPLISLPELSTGQGYVRPLDLAVDGVDALDPAFDAVKGGGGALYREKVIAGCAKRVIWIMDGSKLVSHLSRVPLPVEVVPFGYERTEAAVRSLGFSAALRLRAESPYLTDNGNYILDLTGNTAMDYREKSRELKLLTGVVETGVFECFCEKAVVGCEDAVKCLEVPGRH